MPLPFLEKLVQVLAQGSFSSTYKLAVLLGLIDLCIEAGTPPTAVTTRQLARRVIELYWPQVRAFPATQGVLRQNAGQQAEIASLIQAYRLAHPDRVSPPRPGPSAPADYERLLTDVEWVLVSYPLPRLQRVGREEERFLYEINWGQDVPKSAFTAYRKGSGAFDNRILFQPGAAEALIALAAVIRPLLQQQWMAMLRSINRLPDSELEAFLFGTERVALDALRKPLRALQDKRCFYCADPLSGPVQVDHFLPWSRYPDDGLDNLVLAHESCNRDKLHFLADLDFARRWEDRSRALSDRLDEIAAEQRWSRDRRRTFGVVASVYQGLPDGVRLWAGGQAMRRLGAGDLPAVRAFGQGLLR